MNTTDHPSLETTGTCPLCGTPLGEDHDACTRCDWVRGYRHEERRRRELNPRDIVALALSIVPGAGHIFKGYIPLGLVLILGVPVVCMFAFAFTMFLGWLLIPTYWLGVGLDACMRKDLRPPNPTGSIDRGS